MKNFVRRLGLCVAILGLISGITMYIYGCTIDIPNKHVYVSSSSYAYDYPWDRNVGAQYLGGDAYNYIVEASLKAGYYTGVIVEKTIYCVGGSILAILSAFFFVFSLCCIQGNTSTKKKAKVDKATAVTTEEDKDEMEHAEENVKEVQANQT